MVVVAESLWAEKSKATSRICASCSQGTSLLLPDGKGPNVVKLLTSIWLLSLGKAVVVGPRCWFLLLADWIFSSGNRYIGEFVDFMAVCSQLPGPLVLMEAEWGIKRGHDGNHHPCSIESIQGGRAELEPAGWKNYLTCFY